MGDLEFRPSSIMTSYTMTDDNNFRITRVNLPAPPLIALPKAPLRALRAPGDHAAPAEVQHPDLPPAPVLQDRGHGQTEGCS